MLIRFHPRALVVLSLLTAVFVATAANAQTRIYVSAAAAPGGDGSSWAQAFQHPQAALAAAAAIPLASRNVEIWVAQGRYVPIVPAASRAATFSLLPKVRLYGGFDGTETSLVQRQFRAHLTRLSGDVLGDDTGGAIDPSRAENVYNVVTALNLDSTSSMDGFAIEHGNAALAGIPGSGGGMYCEGGGGFVVRNCTFLSNSSQGNGGAVFCWSMPSAVTQFISCRFLGNSSYSGGAVAAYSYNQGCNDVRLDLINCEFSGNSATEGGGLYLGRRRTSSNCDSVVVSVYGCTFSSDSLTVTGVAGFRGPSILVTDGCRVNVESSVLSALSGITIGVYRDGTASNSYRAFASIGANSFTGNVYSNSSANTPGLGYNGDLAGGPTDVFIDPDGPDNVVGTLDDNNAPLPSMSNIIDMGASWMTSYVYDDIAGNRRDTDGNADGTIAVDKGAYETNSPPYSPVLFVNGAHPSGGDGASWSSAFGGPSALQNALQYASAIPGRYAQIWVAAGIYKPAPSGGSRSASFQLQNNLALYGGFAGNETTLSQRNISANPTILSGDLNGDDLGTVARQDNSLHVVRADSTNRSALMDGMIIERGFCDTLADINGPAIYAPFGSPTFQNVTIRYNASVPVVCCNGTGTSIGSGGVYFGASGGSSSPMFCGCMFFSNAGGSAGAVTVVGTGEFRSCVFEDNSASTGSGAIELAGPGLILNCQLRHNSGPALSVNSVSGGTATIVSSEFTSNRGWAGGATVLTSATFIGCLFAGNRSDAPYSGGGLFYSATSGSVLGLINCSLSGNYSAGPSRGAIFFDGRVGGTLDLRNCVVWNNPAASGSPYGIATDGVDPPLAIQHSTIQYPFAFAGPSNKNTDPQFRRAAAAGADGVWGTADDDLGDLRLSAESTAIDSGNSNLLPQDSWDVNANGVLTELLPLDILGFPRFVDDPAVANTGTGTPPVDRGCYESQVNCLTCPGPREWRSPLGGAFDFPGNWSPSIPLPTHDTLFNLSSTYTVTLPAFQSLSTNSATFGAGAVILDLAGGTLAQSAISDTSLTVGSVLNSVASLEVLHGTLTAVDARIGADPGSAGTLKVGAGATVSTSRSLTVGFQGRGTMNISGGGHVFSRDASVGDQATSSGSVFVSGAGSSWNIPFFLIIDHGLVNVSSGASVTTGFGTYLFNDGTIGGDGTINGPVINFGAISPGNSPGTLTINGSYQQIGQIVGLGDVSGKLIAQASGSGSGQFDKLVVNGAATLGGGLSLSLMNNYVPAPADQLQVVTATGGLTKPFDVVFFPALDNTAASSKYFRAAYSGLRGPGSGSVTINLGNLATTPSFNTPSQYTLDNPPNSVAVGDLNNDGLPDVAITIPDPVNPTTSTGVVVVLFNQGGSGQNWQGFAPHLPGNPTTIAPIPVGLNPTAAAIARLDPASGGSNHLIIANTAGNSLSVLKLASGAMQTVATQNTDPEPLGLAATDFSGLGGNSDIVVVACGGGSIATTGSMTMLANTTTSGGGGGSGAVSFIRRNIPAPSGHKPIHPRPFNPDQDKDIDLAVAMISTNGGSDIVAVYANGLNSGAPSPVPDLYTTLNASAMVPVGSGPVQTLAGKLSPITATNPAGKKEDLITVNTAGNSISVVINTSASQDAPTFAPAVDFAFDVTGAAGTAAVAPRSAVIADLDSTGTLDVAVVANNPSGTNRVVKLLRNDSTTNLGVTQVAFAQMPDLASGSKPLAIVNADLDGDGQTDLMTINSTSGRDTPNTIQVVRNALGAPATSVGACCNGANCVVEPALQCAGPAQRFVGTGTACNATASSHIPCCRADFDQNGAVTIADIFAFLNAWFAGNHQADTDDNGTLAIADIFSFLNAWFSGC